MYRIEYMYRNSTRDFAWHIVGDFHGGKSRWDTIEDAVQYIKTCQLEDEPVIHEIKLAKLRLFEEVDMQGLGVRVRLCAE